MSVRDVEWYLDEVSACRREIAEAETQIRRSKAKKKEAEANLELALVGLEAARRQFGEAMALLKGGEG